MKYVKQEILIRLQNLESNLIDFSSYTYLGPIYEEIYEIRLFQTSYMDTIFFDATVICSPFICFWSNLR